MPLIITDMELDTAELLSLVDKGASGDNDNRPSIVLFKRKKPGLVDRVVAAIKGFGQFEEPTEKAEPMDVNAVLDQLGLTEEQKMGILKLLEALKEKPAEGATVPEQKQEPEKKEEEEMSKRDKEILELEKKHKEDLEKRDARIKKLEEAAEYIELEKKAKELEYLPESRENVIKLLKGATKEVVELLEKTNKAMKESQLFRSFGSTSGGELSTMVEKREKEIKEEMVAMEKRGEKADYHVAFEKVCDRNPKYFEAEIIDGQH